MRLTLEAFGRELTLTFSKPDSDDDTDGVHDNTAAQVEQASGWADYYAADCFGFGATKRKADQ